MLRHRGPAPARAARRSQRRRARRHGGRRPRSTSQAPGERTP